MNLPRSCAVPKCPEVVVGTSRCPTHTVSNTQRTSSQARKRAHRMKQEQPCCTSCGSPGTAANPLTIDHIVPLSKGGSNARENLMVLCYRCNRTKSDAVGPLTPIRNDDNTIVIA
jgi:5-methylcytosine-specific restriction endonuclease McrA